MDKLKTETFAGKNFTFQAAVTIDSISGRVVDDKIEVLRGPVFNIGQAADYPLTEEKELRGKAVSWIEQERQRALSS